MRNFVSLVSISLAVVATAAVLALPASAAGLPPQTSESFMPPNHLDLQDRFDGGGLTEAQFNAIIDKAESVYRPIFTSFGATFSVDRLWSDATVNAYADQSSPTSWQVHMFGGLARRSEVTEDGFAMVICHEMGHHLGGYPFTSDWAANEGQADTHATGACAYKMFGMNLELSARARTELPAAMKAKCDSNHPEAERDICYRALYAGKSLGDLLAALEGASVSFDTPDTNVVSATDNAHPQAQCRLDTYVAAALCGNSKWDYGLIPGKSFGDNNSTDAQSEAFKHSCPTGDGARPACWFAAVGG